MPSSSRRLREILIRLALGVVVTGMAGCGAVTAFVPPVGPGEPAPDAGAAWTRATGTCRAVTSYKGQLRVSGRIAGDRLPTTVNIATGVSSAGLRIEARAAGRSIFKMAGTPARATLYIDDGHRYAVDTPEALTEALAGVKLGPDRWLALLTGCGLTAGTMTSGARYGQQLSISTSTGRAFLGNVNGEWRVMHGLFDGIGVTYKSFAAEWPHEWNLASEAGRDPSVSLTIKVDDTTVGDPLAPSIFTLDLPADATPMSLDELRQSGPLRHKDR